MDNYIFLDIDGVLNTQKNFGKRIESDKYKILLDICHKYNPKIIITSEWRKDMKFVKEELKEISKYIENRTTYSGNRKFQITKFIKDYEITNYIIIDDDISLVKGLENVIIVDGLNEMDKKIIEKKLSRMN